MVLIRIRASSRETKPMEENHTWEKNRDQYGCVGYKAQSLIYLVSTKSSYFSPKENSLTKQSLKKEAKSSFNHVMIFYELNWEFINDINNQDSEMALPQKIFKSHKYENYIFNKHPLNCLF